MTHTVSLGKNDAEDLASGALDTAGQWTAVERARLDDADGDLWRLVIRDDTTGRFYAAPYRFAAHRAFMVADGRNVLFGEMAARAKVITEYVPLPEGGTYPRGRDVSRVLTEVRTVHSRAENALRRFDFTGATEWQPLPGNPKRPNLDEPMVADADGPAIGEALRGVVALLDPWRKTGSTLRRTPNA
ncbi:hypothetical protein GCM10022221_67920 [Actinocorallia aurea]